MNIYRYNDFLEFIRDSLEARKQNGESLNSLLSDLADVSGLNSITPFKLFLSGQRNFPRKQLKKLEQFLEKDSFDSEYFHMLYEVSRGEMNEESLAKLESLRPLQEKSGVERICNPELESSLLTCFILSQFDVPGFEYSMESIRANIPACYTNEEIKKYLDLLLDAGILYKDKNGKVRKSGRHHFFSLTPECQMKFNRDTISLLNFATDSLIVPMKNQSTWFLNMREEDFEAASKDIFEFMKKFVAKYDQVDSPGEHVCLLHHDLISLEVLLKNSKA